MNTNSKYRGLRSLVLIAVASVLVFAAIGFTGAAAQAAIPGDALYPVKTTIEQSRLSMAADAGDRALMRIKFAEQRLGEIAVLIEEGRYQEVGAAVLAFELDIHSSILELETLSQVDPVRGSQIALEITGALTRYARMLSTMAASAPQSVATEVTRALETTQIASGLEMPSGVVGSDDNSNENANSNLNDNGNFNGEDDNANINGEDDNANSNGDDDNATSNTNDNANLNGADDNGNCSDDSGDDDSSGICSDENSNSSNNNGDDSTNGNSNDVSGNDNGDDNSGGGSNDNGGGGGGGNDNGSGL